MVGEYRNRIAWSRFFFLLPFLLLLTSGCSFHDEDEWSQYDPQKTDSVKVLLQKASYQEQSNLKEINRRLDANLLSPEEISLVAQEALKIQKSAAEQVQNSSLIRDWLSILGKLDQQDKLTPVERVRFIDQLVSTNVIFRETLRQGDPLCILLEAQHYAPPFNNSPPGEISYNRTNTVVRVGNLSHTFPDTEPVYIGTDSPSESADTIDTSTLSPGQYNITIEWTINYYQQFDTLDESFITQSLKQSCNGKLAILPSDSEIPLTCVNDAATEQKLKDNLTAWIISPWEHTPLIINNSDATRLQIRTGKSITKNLPVSIAAEIWIGTHDGFIPIGTFQCLKNKNLSAGKKIDYPNTPTTTVILKYSEKLALENPRIDEVWCKDIVFENLPVGKQ